MTEPTRTDVQKQVSWCMSGCFETNATDPEWAAKHREATGHTTGRRTWTVETWLGGDV